VPRLGDILERCLAAEQYAIAYEDLLPQYGNRKSALKSALARQVKKGTLVALRKGFYLILPPRYRSSGKLPIGLYVEQLFQYLGRPYYVGLYSAARMHGAAHQQIQRDYIISTPPKLRAVRKGVLDIRFFSTQIWPNVNLQQQQSDAGIFLCSSPALTMVDLLHHQNKLGGVNRMLPVLEELQEAASPFDYQQLLSWYPFQSNLQRLGFILEVLLGAQDASALLYQRIGREACYPVLLSPVPAKNPGAVNNRWKVDVNVHLEHDA
jgi:predicted transcriptional regulator of viral defense system